MKNPKVKSKHGVCSWECNKSMLFKNLKTHYNMHEGKEVSWYSKAIHDSLFFSSTERDRKFSKWETRNFSKWERRKLANEKEEDLANEKEENLVNEKEENLANKKEQNHDWNGAKRLCLIFIVDLKTWKT